MIEITINGEKRQLESSLSVAELLDLLELNSRALAVEVNHQIQPRDMHQSTQVNDGDVLEIVTLVGGG